MKEETKKAFFFDVWLYVTFKHNRTYIANLCWWMSEKKSYLESEYKDGSSFGVMATFQGQIWTVVTWAHSLWKCIKLHTNDGYISYTWSYKASQNNNGKNPGPKGLCKFIWFLEFSFLWVALCLCSSGALAVHTFHCFCLLIQFYHFPLFCPLLSIWIWYIDLGLSFGWFAPQLISHPQLLSVFY